MLLEETRFSLKQVIFMAVSVQQPWRYWPDETLRFTKRRKLFRLFLNSLSLAILIQGQRIIQRNFPSRLFINMKIHFFRYVMAGSIYNSFAFCYDFCFGNMYSPILHLPRVKLRCKLQEKLHCARAFSISS